MCPNGAVRRGSGGSSVPPDELREASNSRSAPLRLMNDSEFSAVIKLLEGELARVRERLTWLVVVTTAVAVQLGVNLVLG